MWTYSTTDLNISCLFFECLLWYPVISGQHSVIRVNDKTNHSKHLLWWFGTHLTMSFVVQILMCSDASPTWMKQEDRSSICLVLCFMHHVNATPASLKGWDRLCMCITFWNIFVLIAISCKTSLALFWQQTDVITVDMTDSNKIWTKDCCCWDAPVNGDVCQLSTWV